MAVYVELARTAKRVGEEGGAEVVARLSPELGNIEGMIFVGLESSDPAAAIEAARDLAVLMRFTGLGGLTMVVRAREAAKTLDNEQFEADCIQNLGNIARDRSNHDDARARYEEALPLYRRVGDLGGEAKCIKRLGDIALDRSNHADARARYEEALSLYRCIGDLLGEADCIQSHGDIDLARSNYDDARARYEEALLLYRRVGNLLGEANCIQGLGDLDLARSNHDDARARYEEALLLYRRVGDLLGEANCIRGLGDIDLVHSNHADASTQFYTALALYERISEPYSIGWTHVRLARIAPAVESRREHVEAARAAWESCKRPDLVEQLRQEFGDLPVSSTASPPR